MQSIWLSVFANSTGKTLILFGWRHIRHYLHLNLLKRPHFESQLHENVPNSQNRLQVHLSQNRIHVIPARSLVFGSSDNFKWLDIVQEPVFQKWCKGSWDALSVKTLCLHLADHPLINCFTSSQLAMSKCSRSGFSFRSWFKRLANYIIPYCSLFVR